MMVKGRTNSYMGPNRNGAGGANNNKKILVVDDKPTGRELVRTVLEKGGYEIFEAGDGLEALEAVHRIRPDLIILDLHMPGLDGFGVVKELRRQEDFAQTPCMALTASAMQGDRQRALDAGFTGYITKPVSLKALRAEVERLLA
jgi:CheY-like chemotaxis protein